MVQIPNYCTTLHSIIFSNNHNIQGTAYIDVFVSSSKHVVAIFQLTTFVIGSGKLDQTRRSKKDGKNDNGAI